MDQLKKEFGQIYDDNVDKIYRFVYLKVNSREIAQDITADTFAKAWKSYISSQKGFFKKKVENHQAFCYRIARNLVTDYYRKKPRISHASLESVSVVDTGSNLEEKAMINSDMEMVKKALAGIKDEHQDVIIWRYLDELSVAEIATLIGKSEGATRVLVHRAMETLKSSLVSSEEEVGEIKES